MSLPVESLTVVLGPLAEALWQRYLEGHVGSFLFGLGIAALPTGTGIAILSYRLYDIDVIINQALVYAPLTAVLAIVYLAAVLIVGTCCAPSADRGRAPWQSPSRGLRLGPSALAPSL